MDLAQRKVLLTGATGGIGAALAWALAAQGAHLRLHGRDRERMRGLCAKLPTSTTSLLGDLREASQRQALIEFAADADVVILNAASGHFGAFESMSEAQIEQLLLTDLLMPMLLTRSLLPLLRRRPNSRLVLIGSTLGQIGHPGYVAYGATKGGLRTFAEALRRELGGAGPGLLYVSPRATRTAMNTGAAAAMNSDLGTATDSPEHVAETIVQALLTDRKRCQLGWPEALLLRVNALAPALLDKGMAARLPVIRRHLDTSCTSAPFIAIHQEIKP